MKTDAVCHARLQENERENNKKLKNSMEKWREPEDKIALYEKH